MYCRLGWCAVRQQALACCCMPCTACRHSPPTTQGQEQARQQAVQAIEPWLDRFDAVVIGPGLGRDPLILSTVAEVRSGGVVLLWVREAGSGRCAAACSSQMVQRQGPLLHDTWQPFWPPAHPTYPTPPLTATCHLNTCR